MNKIMLEKDTNYYKSTRVEMLRFIPTDCKKILDVGCGEGNFCLQLNIPNLECWGIEPDKTAAEIAAEKMFKVLNSQIENVIDELPDNYFDLIIFNDILEHLVDPWDILKRIRPKIANDGKIVCSIPNVRYIRNLIHVLLKKDWHYGYNGILDSTHLRFFTRKSIIEFIKSCGYEIIEIRGINRTKSERLMFFTFLINLFTFFRHFDIIYLQFAVVAKPAK